VGETHGRGQTAKTNLERVEYESNYKFNPYRLGFVFTFSSTGFTGGYPNLTPAGFSNNFSELTHI